jgi:hypothetical protein
MSETFKILFMNSNNWKKRNNNSFSYIIIQTSDLSNNLSYIKIWNKLAEIGQCIATVWVTLKINVV